MKEVKEENELIRQEMMEIKRVQAAQGANTCVYECRVLALRSQLRLDFPHTPPYMIRNMVKSIFDDGVFAVYERGTEEGMLELLHALGIEADSEEGWVDGGDVAKDRHDGSHPFNALLQLDESARYVALVNYYTHVEAALLGGKVHFLSCDDWVKSGMPRPEVACVNNELTRSALPSSVRSVLRFIECEKACVPKLKEIEALSTSSLRGGKRH